MTIKAISPFSPGYRAASIAPIANATQRDASSMLSVNSTIGPPQLYQLANGLPAYVQQSPQAPDCQLTVQIDTPSRSIANNLLLASLITESSRQSKALLNDLSARGVDVAVSSGPRGIELHLSGLRGQEPWLIQWAQYLLTNPSVDPYTFQTYLQDTIKGAEEEIKQPEVQLSDAVFQQFYGAENPWAQTSVNTLAQLKQMKLATVSGGYQQLLQQSGPVKLILNSSYSPNEQVALLNQYWGYRPQSQLPSPPNHYPLNMQGNKRVLVAKNDVKRAFIQKLWKAPKLGDPDYASFLVLREVLGSQSWGFFRELRMRRGLVYRANKNYSDIPQAPHYSVDFEVDFDKIQGGIDGLNTVVGEVMQQGITREQLQSAKKKATMELRQIIETNSGLNGYMTQFVDADQPPIHPQQLLSAINRVSLVDVQQTAQRVFGPTNTSVLGILAPDKVLSAFKNRGPFATPSA